MDFQDVITMVLLYLPHSLTSIAHQKTFLVPVTLAFSPFPSKKIADNHPPNIPIPALHSSVIFTWPGTSS